MVKENTQVNKIPLFDSKGKKQDTIELDKDVFNGKFNEALLYQSVVMHLANQRKGHASTKTRGDVRGGGKKPWKQKGTGRARASSIRSPLWRGGGISFGPHPRDFRYTLPKKIKRRAILASLNVKLKSGQVLALENETIATPKTRDMASLLEKLNIGEKVLLLVEKIDKNLFLATRNLKNLALEEVQSATAFSILSHDTVILTKSAIGALNKRVG